MAKVTLNPIGSFSQVAITTINNNMDRIEEALEKTLTRDGTSPNQLSADLDMNHNDILNVNVIDADEVRVDGTPLDQYIDDKLQITIVDADAVQILDEDDMSSDSDTGVPTQQSVKAYVDDLRNDVVIIGDQRTILIDEATSITTRDLTQFNRVEASRYNNGNVALKLVYEKTTDPIEFLGNNITTAGNMSTPGVWTLGTNLTVTGGLLTATSAGAERTALYGAGIVNQHTPLAVGDTYEVTFTVSGYAGGSVTPQFGSGGSAILGTARTADGTFTERLVCPAGGDIRLIFSAGAALSVDNLFVYRVGTRGFTDAAGNRFALVADKVIPQMFGAVGDGVADDTSAVRSADAYANNKNVTLSGFGTYLISSQIQLSTANVDMMAATIKLADSFPHTSGMIVRSASELIDRRSFVKLFFDGNRSGQGANRGRSGPACFEVFANPVASAKFEISGQNACVGVKVSASSEHKHISAFFEATDTVVWWTQYNTGGTGDSTPDVGQLSLTAHDFREAFYMESPDSTHGGSVNVTMNVEGHNPYSGSSYYPAVSILGADTGVQIGGQLRGTSGTALFINQKHVPALSSYGTTVTLNNLFILNSADTNETVVDVQSVSRLSGRLDIALINAQDGLSITEITKSIDLKVSVNRLESDSATRGVVLQGGSGGILSGFLDVTCSQIGALSIPLKINNGQDVGQNNMLFVRFSTDGTDATPSELRDPNVCFEGHSAAGVTYNAEITPDYITRKDLSCFRFTDRIVDDAMITFTPPRPRGFIKVTDRSNLAANYLLAAYWAGATPVITSIAGSATSEVSTTKVVTVSSDATDGNFKVTSTSDGFIQVVNRLGANTTFDIELS